MGVLSRSAVVITPRQPYLDWAKQDDTTGVAERGFETLRREPHVYLVREHEDAESGDAVLAGISDLPAPDGPFIHLKAAQRTKRLFVTASSRFRGRQLSAGGRASH